MPEVANEPLRSDVLAGRFFGKAAAATDVAAFIAGASQLSHLRTWFGDDWVRQTLSREQDRSDIVRAALDRDIAAIDALFPRSSMPFFTTAGFVASKDPGAG